MRKHLISREIGIDAGHRIPLHDSKCRSPHGHRYKVVATCYGDLFEDGAQQGMVLDFGFLKDEMMVEVDAPCDHATILSRWDAEYLRLFAPANEPMAAWTAALDRALGAAGSWSGRAANGWKLYVVPFAPTAENLARHWYERLAPRVAARSAGRAALDHVMVWETPNCAATYPA